MNKDHKIEHDNFSVTQTGKCFDSLSVSNFQPTMINWSTSNDMVAIADPVKDIFVNSEAEGCPITKCSLMKMGCTEPYTDKDISISSMAPFTVSTIQNVFEGVNKLFCVKCSTKGMELEADNIRIQ